MHLCRRKFELGYKDNIDNIYCCKHCYTNQAYNTNTKALEVNVNRAGNELINIDVKLVYKNMTINTKAMIDIRANKYIIHDGLVLVAFINKLKQPIKIK